MLFYTALFLACVAIAAVGIWLYRSLAGAAKAVYRAMLPSSRHNFMQFGVEDVGNAIQGSPTPWGWSNSGSARRAIPVRDESAKTATATPWGWPGNGRNAQQRRAAREASGGGLNEAGRKFRGASRSRQTPMVGWPYREEPFESPGRKYKAERRKKARKISPDKVAKPWGW